MSGLGRAGGPVAAHIQSMKSKHFSVPVGLLSAALALLLTGCVVAPRGGYYGPGYGYSSVYGDYVGPGYGDYGPDVIIAGGDYGGGWRGGGDRGGFRGHDGFGGHGGGFGGRHGAGGGGFAGRH